MYVVKTKAHMRLCFHIFVKSRFSHDAAHMQNHRIRKKAQVHLLTLFLYNRAILY